MFLVYSTYFFQVQVKCVFLPFINISRGENSKARYVVLQRRLKLTLPD